MLRVARTAAPSWWARGVEVAALIGPESGAVTSTADGVRFMGRCLRRLGVPVRDDVDVDRVAVDVALKYGVCLGGGLVSAAACFAALDPVLATPPALVAFACAFYGAEAQLVFLVPAALTTTHRGLGLWRAARALTTRAGGTIAVASTVVPIAARMIIGARRASWLAGCAAVCAWYAALPADDGDTP